MTLSMPSAGSNAAYQALISTASQALSRVQ